MTMKVIIMVRVPREYALAVLKATRARGVGHHLFRCTESSILNRPHRIVHTGSSIPNRPYRIVHIYAGSYLGNSTQSLPKCDINYRLHKGWASGLGIFDLSHHVLQLSERSQAA